MTRPNPLDWLSSINTLTAILFGTNWEAEKKPEHLELAMWNRMVYCPYTDREIPESGTSREHIIPLSLGGVNGFEIAIDAAFNSKVGTELDGALANEFLIALRRAEYDTRGHSGKEPIATVRATYGEDDRPAQVHFHQKKGISLWDAQDRETKKGSATLRIKASLNIDLPWPDRPFLYQLK